MKKGKLRGTYMIDPNAIFQGGQSKRLNILLKYETSEEWNETQTQTNPDVFVETPLIDHDQNNRRIELENGEIISSKEKAKEEIDRKIKALQDRKEELEND